MTRTIPEEAKLLYFDLSHEVQMLHIKWILFSQLFAEPEAVDLLNKHTPTFFYFVQWVLLDDISLALARLVDAPKHRELERASFGNLILKINDGQHNELVNALNVHMENLKEKCKPFTGRRHRILAHRDLLTALDVHPEPLTEISRQMIGDALDAVRTFMNEIELYVTQGEISYEHFIFEDDAHTLLDLLRLGIQQYEAKMADD